MSKTFVKLSLIVAAASVLQACAVAKTTGKIAALPVKAVYKTGELAGKTVYHTGRIAGTGLYETGKLAGKTAIATGKGVYYVDTVPVKVTNAALDTTARVLTITTQAVDLTGKVVTVSRDIQAMQLDGELQALKSAKNIISVFVDRKG